MNSLRSSLSSMYRLISADIPAILTGSSSTSILRESISIRSSKDFIVFATIRVSSRSNTMARQRRLSIPTDAA
uniref:CPL2 n=1 Tax=Arundo donax TaxID=35708 RepID=A0A0A9GQ55_ARUDO